MNICVLVKTLGNVLFWESILMLPPFIVSLIYRSYEYKAFIISIIILLSISLFTKFLPHQKSKLRKKESYAVVAISWIIISLFGALPFYISGCIPSYVDAFFETVSGFTTTGASIINNIDTLPHGILLWRSLTVWIGGVGVLVLMIALTSSSNSRTIFLMKAESPGPSPSKLVPKISDSSKIIYVIYSVITLIIFILLMLCGMPIFDSLIHALGTAGTGGFSNRGTSIGFYNNPMIEYIITIGMFFSGTNFSLYFLIMKGNLQIAIKDEEFKLYFIILLICIFLIFINIFPLYNYSIEESFRHSAFSVTSIITSTGFSTEDFNLWPMFSKSILFLLMFTGACAGSTTGGIKLIRILVLLKISFYEMIQTIHPHSIHNIKINGKSVNNESLRSIMIFFFLYFAIIFCGMIVVSLDNLDFTTTFTSVVASISNIGPGFGLIGPLQSFSIFSDVSKIILSIIMIIGRLELIPILVLLQPSIYTKQ